MGYVGRELVHLYAADSRHTVTVFDLNEQTHQKFPSNVHSIVGDIRDAQLVKKTVADTQPSLVYNLAAIHYIPYCIEHPDEVVSTNITGTQNIIDALRPLKDTRFIFASSASIYGSPDSKAVETDVYNPNDIYGASKVAGEVLIRTQLSNYVIIRLFNVFGKTDPHPHLIPKVVAKLSRGEKLELGTKKAERDFVYIDDAARGFYLAASAESGEIFNLGTGETHTVQEVVDTVQSATKSRSEIVFNTPANIRKKDADYLCADNTKIVSQLGWKSTVSFAVGINTTVS